MSKIVAPLKEKPPTRTCRAQGPRSILLYVVKGSEMFYLYNYNVHLVVTLAHNGQRHLQRPLLFSQIKPVIYSTVYSTPTQEKYETPRQFGT